MGFVFVIVWGLCLLLCGGCVCYYVVVVFVIMWWLCLLLCGVVFIIVNKVFFFLFMLILCIVG